MSSYQPFIYLIGWSKLDRWYIGARYRKGTKPSDLWTVYFTSSVHVTAMRYLHGEPDVIRTFNTLDKDDTLNQEAGVIFTLNAVHDKRFLNKCCNSLIWHYTPGYVYTEEARAKISKAAKMRVQSPASIAKMKATKAANPKPSPNRGKKASDETKAKMRAAHKRRAERKATGGTY